MAYILTYAKLVQIILDWVERQGDTSLLAQAPLIIMLAENRIARDAKILGNQLSVTGDLVAGVGGSILAKPVRWNEPISFWYGTAPDNRRRTEILLRNYGYCRRFWPNPHLTAAPMYYAVDADWDNLLIAPTPDAIYPYELVYYQRDVPLDDANETNWWTGNAPEVLIEACIFQAQMYLKGYEVAQAQETVYLKALRPYLDEKKRQLLDASIDVEDK